jgi:hypothetical protein
MTMIRTQFCGKRWRTSITSSSSGGGGGMSSLEDAATVDAPLAGAAFVLGTDGNWNSIVIREVRVK